MSEYGLPCIVCKTPLRNALNDVDNQPEDGVAAQTHGNYGSTVWDSFHGEYLEFNVCDECLRAAGEAGLVHVAVDKQPLNYEGFRVGYVDVTCFPVPWTPGMEQWTRDDIPLYSDDDLDALPLNYHIDKRAYENARSLIQAQDRVEGRNSND